MPKRAASQPAEAVAEVECAAPDCSVRFSPRRSTARYHSATCRQRAGRARKAAAANAADEAKSEGDAEHGLVRAVRLELEKAKAIDTVSGQLALQVARRIANPEESGISALSKELRSLLAEAKGPPPAAPGGDEPSGSAEPESDEVKRAREARDRKRAGLGEAATG